MIGQQDFEVFRKGIHGAVKGLYTAYEVGIRLRTAWREIEKKDERIRNLEAHAEKAERELRKAQTAELRAAGQSNPVVDERVTQRLLSHAIADRDTASMFAIETARSVGYEKGFYDSWKVGIEKTKEKLAEEVCRCENRGFRHGWIKALQAAEALQEVGIESTLPLYQRHHFPFGAFEIEKSDDEGDAE